MDPDSLLTAGQPAADKTSRRGVDPDALLAAAKPVAQAPAPRRRAKKDRLGFVMPNWAR